MNFKRITAMLLLVLMIIPAFSAWSVSADMSTGEFVPETASASTIASKLDGETSRTTKTLYTGVTRTSIKTSSSSKYETESFHILEFDPSQADLYVDVTNEKTYANNTQTTLNTVKAFNSNNGQGKTAIAAVNGDLWMTGTFSVATKTVTLPRGFNVYNGEIITSAHMPQETPYQGEFWSFGMTNDSVPMIGCPELDISVKNNSKGSVISADGLNRLPADNALVVYTDKGCLNNYAKADAYEVVIDVSSDYTVKHGASITGTVTGIYSSSSSTDPTMQANRIILTARGSKTLLLNNYAVGNSVTLSFSVTERYGRNTAGWQDVYCAVGGHMPFVVDGAKWETGTTNNYPSTIVGIKNDGNVVFIANDIGTTGSRGGLDFNDYWDFADDMDLNTAFILDGGGSTTFVDNSSGSYAVINNPTDGSPRSVVNSVILSAGPKKTNIGEYELKFPDDTIDLTNLYFATDDAFMMLTNFAETKIEKTSSGAKLKVADFFNGPTVSISYGLPNATSTNGNSALINEYHYSVPTADYPYLVLDMSIVTADASAVQFQALYHTSGSRKGVSDTTSLGFNNAYNNAGFKKYVINPGSSSSYTGDLNTFRLLYLFAANGVTVKDGDYVILRSARLASSLAEANAIAAESAPKMQTVTLNANGGSCAQTRKYAVQNTYYGTMPTPKRAGYTFKGWYTAASGGTKIDSDSVVTASISRTLYAQWTEGGSTHEPDDSYTITFDANGGTMSGTSKFSITKGQQYSEVISSMPSATKEGYTLTGWYCEKYNYTLSLSDTFSVDENVTFKAVWTLNAADYPTGTYSTTASWLTLRAGPGTSYASMGSVAKGTVVEVTAVSGRWGNCIYNGQSVWLSLAYAELVSETTTTYTLTFDTNGGKMPSGYSTTYEFLADEKFVDVIGGFPVPTRDGYEFTGWKNTLTGTSDLWSDGWGSQPYTYGADITLQAQWSAHSHNYTSSVTKAATCTEAGTKTFRCACGDSYTEAIAALGHSYTTTTTAATCTAAGKTVKTCSRCGDTTTTTIPALGHDYKTTTTDATCTAEGKTVKTCQRCGDTVTTVIPMIGHSWGEWVETLAPTTTSVGVETRTCTVCGATETQDIPMLSADAPVIAGVYNYTVTLNGINNIKEIRFAIGHYTKGADVKAAEKNVTMDVATVNKYTVDGVMTYDLPWMGEYTFWVRLNDGTSYFLYTNVDEITPYVESYGVKMTVKDYAENYKDMWIAEGTWNSYSEIKNQCTGFKYQASASKLDLYAKTTHDFSYTFTDPGDYTVLIRYNDGSVDVIHHTLTVDVPVFTENGLQITVSNIPDIKIIRTAYGRYDSVAAIKAASGVRNFSNKNDIKNASEYMIQFREEGEVTLIVEYNNGYKHFYYYNVEQKIPTMVQNGNTVTFGDLEDLYIIRYAPGKYTTATNIKNAPGAKYAKADSIDANGEIVFENLTAGRWSFMVQYNDESYNFYVIDVE